MSILHPLLDSRPNHDIKLFRNISLIKNIIDIDRLFEMLYQSSADIRKLLIQKWNIILVFGQKLDHMEHLFITFFNSKF